MKISKELILIVIILTALVAVNVYRAERSRYRSPKAAEVKYASFSAGEHGAKALYLLLGRLGYEPQRLRWPHLADMQRDGLAIVLVPNKPPINKADSEKILEWLRRGNTLIFFPGDNIDQLSESLDIKLINSQLMQASLAPLAFTDLTTGIERLAIRSGDRILTDRPEAVQHFGDSDGGVIVSLKEGKGTVIAISDPYIVTNSGLMEGDNLRVMVNILLSHTSDTGTVYFDEYHHGFERHPSVLHLVKGTSLGWALLQITIAVLLLMYSRGRRFGYPVPVLKEEHRSSLEYVTSLAGIYRTAQAPVVALSDLYERLVRSLGNRPLSGSIGELMDECESRINSGGVSEKELMALSKRMELVLHPKEGK